MRGMVAQLVLMVVIIQLYSIAELAAEDKKLHHSGESLIILGVILSNVSPRLLGWQEPD